MRRRAELIALILYAMAGIADAAHHLANPSPGDRANPLAALPVAFCAGLFWPIDIIARPLLMGG